VTRWWTNREVAQLVRLAADGMVASQIATVFGRTPGSVFARARRDGVTLAMTRAAPRTIALSNLPVGGVSGGDVVIDLTIPPGGFGAIYADPPWAFRTFSGENMTPHRCAEDHYRTMTLAELKALPISDIAARDCALFMWVVGSHLAESIELASTWGFTFKTDAFYWIKQRLIGADQIDLFTGDIPEPRMGFGYWTRKQVEPCWLFTRGSPRRLSKGVRQVILEPRREHSRKPEAARERIEQLVSGPYLELFARTSRPVWSAWGNEVGKFADAAA